MRTCWLSLGGILGFLGEACAQCTLSWSTGGIHRGFDDTVYCSVVCDLDGPGPNAPELVIGGAFQFAGASPIPYLAAWNGHSWRSVGGAPNAPVRTLHVHEGTLYAGGDFQSIDGAPLSHIAQWTGTSWIPLSSGSNIPVQAMASYSGQVYASGSYTGVGNLARWDGSAWFPLNPQVDGVVAAMCVHQGSLFFTGNFSAAPTSSFLAMWDGATVSNIPVTGRMVPWPRCIASFANTLFIGGRNFNSEPCVVTWNDPYFLGTSGLHSFEFEWPEAHSLSIIDNEFYCAGYFVGAVAKWDGSHWQFLPQANIGPEEYPSAWTISSYQNDLCVGGNFSSVAGRAINMFARRRDGVWLPSSPLPAVQRTSRLRALASDASNRYIGGYLRLTEPDGTTSIGAARFDGQRWHAMPGLNEVSNPEIQALAHHNGFLHAAGALWASGASHNHAVLQWTGSAWIPTVPGIQGTGSAMTTYQGDLVLGGYLFLPSGGTTQVALLHKGSWEALGQAPSPVTALTVHDGVLYAGGGTVFPSPVGFVVRWSGTQWESVGTWPAQQVTTLVSHDGRLIAAGEFNSPVGQLGVAAWTDSQWQWLLPPSGNPVRGIVSAVAFSGDRLAVSGSIYENSPIAFVAIWDQSTLQMHSSFVRPGTYTQQVQDLAWLNDGIWVAGAFDSVAGVHSQLVARLGAPPSNCYANCDCSSPHLSALDFQCFLDRFAAGDAYANCDNSSGTPILTSNDFQCFLDRFASGCP